MASQPSLPGATLLEAVRIAARGGDLDGRLEQLAQHVRQAIDASFVAFFLYDSATRILVPAGTAGLTAEETGRGQLTAEDEDDPVARAVRDRQVQVAQRLEVPSALLAMRPGLSAAVAAPLVAEDAGGQPEVQGVLAAGFDGPLADAGQVQEQLEALADLAAVAIRQSRLEQALLEHVDWLDRVAHTDPLTGLANRRTFERMLELELARASRQGTVVSVALFDVDSLSAMTDSAGGAAADDVLRRVASTLADSVRLVDTIARFGRDEFALIAPGSGGGVVARRVRDGVAQLEPTGEYRPSVSSGVARYPDEGASLQELLEAAGAALDRARAQGPGSVVVAGEG